MFSLILLTLLLCSSATSIDFDKFFARTYSVSYHFLQSNETDFYKIPICKSDVNANTTFVFSVTLPNNPDWSSNAGTINISVSQDWNFTFVSLTNNASHPVFSIAANDLRGDVTQLFIRVETVGNVSSVLYSMEIVFQDDISSKPFPPSKSKSGSKSGSKAKSKSKSKSKDKPKPPPPPHSKDKPKPGSKDKPKPPGSKDKPKPKSKDKPKPPPKSKSKSKSGSKDRPGKTSMAPTSKPSQAPTQTMAPTTYVDAKKFKYLNQSNVPIKNIWVSQNSPVTTNMRFCMKELNISSQNYTVKFSVIDNLPGKKTYTSRFGLEVCSTGLCAGDQLVLFDEFPFSANIRELNSTQFEESALSSFNVSLHSLTQKKFGSTVRLYAFLERSVSDGSTSENGGASGSASGARTDTTLSGGVSSQTQASQVAGLVVLSILCCCLLCIIGVLVFKLRQAKATARPEKAPLLV